MALFIGGGPQRSICIIQSRSVIFFLHSVHSGKYGRGGLWYLPEHQVPEQGSEFRSFPLTQNLLHLPNLPEAEVSIL